MTRAWDALAELPAWLITQIPRPRQPCGDNTEVQRDAGTGQRFQALAAACGRADPVAIAWAREEPGGQVRVLAAGSALAAGHDQGQAVLTLPAGARGARLAPRDAAETLARIPCWTRLAGVNDILLADDTLPDGQNVGLAPPSLEDGLLSAWLGAFAWLLLAEPIPGGELDELTSQAALSQLTAQQSSSPRSQVSAHRAQARHAELRRAASTGMWRVHLLAGAATPDDAAQVAGLLCASADLAGLPYALVAIPGTGPLPAMLGGTIEPAARDGVRAGDGRHLPGNGIYGNRSPQQAWSATPHAPAHPPAAPVVRPASAEAIIRASEVESTPRPAAPFLASTRLLAALLRAPTREVPGLRFTLQPTFDVTPETVHRSQPPDEVRSTPAAIRIGTVLDWNRMPAGPLLVSPESMNRHVFVCGATGAGKSQTVRGLLEAATDADIPWLVVEPAKAEYQRMAARLPDTKVIRIRPGDLDAPPAGLNPLEPAPGPDGTRFPLQVHADLLRAVFLAAFDADEPFPQVIAAALTRCYEQAGWDLVTGQPASPGIQPWYPTLADLEQAAIQVVEQIGYGREVTDNVRGFITVRVGSLRLGTAGRFLHGAHPLDFAQLLNHNVVLEIEDAGDDRDKAFVMGAVLIRLAEHLRLHFSRTTSAQPLRHLTVLEEAHRLLRQPPQGTAAGPAAHAVEMFADLLAEVRAYGDGLIIAEQIPAKLIPDVIKNTAVKIVHRLPARDDRDTVGATMNLTPSQSRYLVTLPPGEAAVHTDGMDYPVLARMPDGTTRENSSTARPHSPDTVIGHRSPTCGPDCTARPCTLAQIRAAQRLTLTDPRITLWAELAVVAHLTGWTMPMPSEELAANIDAAGARLRDCAISHAVDTAVRARVAAIANRVSPPDLAVHVATAMRHVLGGQGWFCEPKEPRWLAPTYEWSIVLDDLRDYCRDHSDGGPHPDTAEWEVTYSNTIPGATCADQLQVVQLSYEIARRDQGQVDAVNWGTRPQSAFEDVLATRRDDPKWEERLTEALADFPGHRWPLDQLRRLPPEP